MTLDQNEETYAEDYCNNCGLPVDMGDDGESCIFCGAVICDDCWIIADYEEQWSRRRCPLCDKADDEGEEE